MDMMYRATDPRPTRLSADERRKRDADSKRRARRKGYASRGGLDSLRLERWWFEAVGDPMKTALTGDQALGFFNRVGLPREILVRVWEMAKRGRKGEPKGLLQHEFEAACCLASVALFEYPQVVKLPGRDIARHPDAHARKRVGYAQAGMYWKFSAFDLAAAAPTPPPTRHHHPPPPVTRAEPTGSQKPSGQRPAAPPPRPGDSSSEDDEPTPRAVPKFVIRGAPPLPLEPTPPTRAHRDPFATTFPVDDSLVPKPATSGDFAKVAPPPTVSPLPPPPPVRTAPRAADVESSGIAASTATTSPFAGTTTAPPAQPAPAGDFADFDASSPLNLSSLGLDDGSGAARSPDARSPDGASLEPARGRTYRDDLADRIWEDSRYR